MTRWLKPTELRDLAEQRWGHRSTWRCVYCSRSTPDGAVDHFIPRAHGGTDLPWNLVPCCPVCNRSKWDAEPAEWMRAVGVPDATITALQTIARSPGWVKDANGFRWPPLANLDYRAADGLPEATRPLVLPANLAEVYVLDPDGWAPTTALRRIAADYLADKGRAPLSTQQLNQLLEARGLVRTKRKGVSGYRGFHVSPELMAAGRMAAGRTQTAESRKDLRWRRQMAAEVARSTD